MTHNDLWAKAYEYASNAKMSLQRCIQFADDFAWWYERDYWGYFTPGTLKSFEALWGDLVHHYVN